MRGVKVVQELLARELSTKQCDLVGSVSDPKSRVCQGSRVGSVSDPKDSVLSVIQSVGSVSDLKSWVCYKSRVESVNDPYSRVC